MRNLSNSSYSLLDVSFENLTVGLYCIFFMFLICTYEISFKLNVIYYSNKNLFFIHNFISQTFETKKFDWWYSYWSLIFLNFAIIKDIRKTWYLTLIFENSLLIKRRRRILKSVSPNLQTSLEKNLFKLSIKLLTWRLDFSNYIYKMSSQNWKFFPQKKRHLCFLLVIFSPRHNKN